LVKERGGGEREIVEVLFCHTIITDHKLWLCAQKLKKEYKFKWSYTNLMTVFVYKVVIKIEDTSVHFGLVWIPSANKLITKRIQVVQAVGDTLQSLYLLRDLIYGLIRVVGSKPHRADARESSLMS
jgi:hypothetical protein